MTTPQDRIKNLEDELARLKADLEAPKPPTRWVPKLGENYWFIEACGNIDMDVRTANIDQMRINTGNVFRTKREAEAAIPRFYTRLVAMQKLRDAAKGFKPNWSSSHQRKFHLYYSYIRNGWSVDSECLTHRTGIVYFESEVDCQNAINSLTKDELKSLLED